MTSPTEHLTLDAINRLHSGSMTPVEVKAANAHLADCESCRQTFRDAMPDATRCMEELMEEEEDDNLCLNTDLKVRYAYDKTDAWENEWVRMHCADCEFCRGDIEALQKERRELEAESMQEAATSAASPPDTKEPPSASEGSVAAKTGGPSMPWWKRLFPPVASAPAFSAGMAMAAGILLAVLVQQEVAHYSRENALQQQVGTLTSQAAEARQAHKDLETAQRELALAQARTDTLAAHIPLAFSASVPKQIANLATSKGITLGSPKEGAPFQLNYPVGQILESDTPQFRWQPLPGATAYTVGLKNVDTGEELGTSPRFTATTWTPPHPLPRGHNYSWQVTAYRGSQEKVVSYVPPLSPAEFRIVEATIAAQLERLTGDPLSQGILYAEAGMPEEAEARFQKLLQEQPDSPTYRRLLQSAQLLEKQKKQIQHASP